MEESAANLRVLEGSIALGGLARLIRAAGDLHQARTDAQDPNAPQQRDGIHKARGMFAGRPRGGVSRWMLTAHKGGIIKKSPTKEVEEHLDLYLEKDGSMPNQYAQHVAAAGSGMGLESADWFHHRDKPAGDIRAPELQDGKCHPHKFLIAFGTVSHGEVTERWRDPSFADAFDYQCNHAWLASKLGSDYISDAGLMAISEDSMSLSPDAGDERGFFYFGSDFISDAELLTFDELPVHHKKE